MTFTGQVIKGKFIIKFWVKTTVPIRRVQELKASKMGFCEFIDFLTCVLLL